MALQYTYTSDMGITLSSAYARIESITVENPRTEDAFLSVRVAIFADATASTALKKAVTNVIIRSTNAQYNAWINACVNGANPISLVYNFLKNHAQFEGATDV